MYLLNPRHMSDIAVYGMKQPLVEPSQRVLTPEQVKANFRARGIYFRNWAKENGFPLDRVYRALNGQDKAYRGKGHEIAVKLGLKADLDALESHND